MFFHHILSVKYFSTVCHSTTKAQFLMSRIHMSWKIPYISEILITLITVVWSLVMAFLWTWSVFDDLNPFWQTEHEYSFEEWAFLWWEYDEECLKVVPSTSQTEGVILIKSIPITMTVRGKLGSVKSPVTPGVTGAVRRCAPAPFACNTRCYRRTAPGPPHLHLIAFWLVGIDFVASDWSACNSRWTWRRSPVTPGVTGERRL